MAVLRGRRGGEGELTGGGEAGGLFLLKMVLASDLTNIDQYTTAVLDLDFG